jgi:hypothetical protein
MTTSTVVAPPRQTTVSQANPRPLYRCTCGHALRVTGTGRHRLYFPPANTAMDDPVMNRACPECGRGLPGKQAP